MKIEKKSALNNLIFGFMKGNYDNVAPFYDLLSHLVYGKAIVQAHRALVNAIPANSSVLIIGGGTGEVLEEISKIRISGLQITYVEISKKMIAISKKRNTGNSKVIFMSESILDVSLQQHFDVVITPFIFDIFLNNTTEVIFNKINAFLKPNGLWLFADFQLSEKNNWWQKLLLNLMYCFFRLFCGIEAAHLPDTTSLFEKYKYEAASKQTFYRKFIYSVIYLKPDT